MIKVIELVKRPNGMPIEACHQHWRSRHGDVVSAIPGLRRYVQSLTRHGGYRGDTEPLYDGIAELWFDDKDALAAIAGTPEFDAAKADEPNFSDGAALVELVVDSHMLKDGEAPPGGVKSVSLVRFRRDLDPVDARAHWLEVHGPIAAQIPQVRRYVQNHVRPGAYRAGARPPWDGLAVTWFDSIDAMRESARSVELERTRADEANFIDPGPVPVLLTTEHVVIDGPGV